MEDSLYGLDVGGVEGSSDKHYVYLKVDGLMENKLTVNIIACILKRTYCCILEPLFSDHRKFILNVNVIIIIGCHLSALI